MSGFYVQQLDFEIVDTNNKKTIVFIDSSNYFEEPEQPILEIVLPSFNQIFKVNISARRVNTINSSTIGLSSFIDTPCPLDFPDGIYKFNYSICPYETNITKYRLRTTELDCKISEIYSKINCDIYDNERLQTELIQVLLAKESAKANAELFNLQNAEKDFKIACQKTDILYNKLLADGLLMYK